jgi:twitching motility protein PilT
MVSEEQMQLLTTNKELDFAFDYEQYARFRVNAYHQRGTMAAALRLIPKVIPQIEELNLPPICHTFAGMQQGLILVTGPTGQGKSTTLASILGEINGTRSVHIVTVEDPIEYVHEPKNAVISQREMHGDTHSWEVALRSVLREDPDVVLVGEMRDFETIAAALTIAETGHLVFATLHTNSAAQTVDRIVDVFPPHQQSQIRMQLASTLAGVFSQRLLPAIGGGRIIAHEILLGNSAVRTTIREGKTHMIDNILMTSADVGMNILESSLQRLVQEGMVDGETAIRYAARPDELNRMLYGGKKKRE